MFIVLLRFSSARSRAGALMEGHRAFIQRGLDDGVFLLVGTLEPGAGGVLLATAASRGALEARLAQDPFVVEDVVKAEVLEVTPSRTDERLAFLG